MMFTKMWHTILVYCSSEVKILLSLVSHENMCKCCMPHSTTVPDTLISGKRNCVLYITGPHDNCGCPAPFRFHYFPKSDLAVREEWVRRVGRQEADGKKRWEPRKDSVLCSEHFVNGAPSAEYPIPWFKLGRDFGTPRPARRVLFRTPPEWTIPAAEVGLGCELTIGDDNDMEVHVSSGDATDVLPDT